MFAVRQVWRVVWHRFRATFGRRWAGLLAIVLLIGLVGGLAMGALAGARRTQSAFPHYLASTNASDLQAAIFSQSPTATNAYSPVTTSALERLPLVRHVAGSVAVFASPLQANGAPNLPEALNNNEVTPIGTVNGEYFGQDRVRGGARPDGESSACR